MWLGAIWRMSELVTGLQEYDRTTATLEAKIEKLKGKMGIA
jgi:hypothetical protein